MMGNKWSGIIGATIICLVFVVAGCVLGFYLGVKLQTEHCKRISIKQGIAQYDTQTGEFMWKEVGE